MVLTETERIKFAEWCEMQADSNEGIARQAGKIGMPEPLLRMLDAETQAMRVVANKLRNTESQEIKGA